jgi:DNA-binding transcriptional regulator PaaX
VLWQTVDIKIALIDGEKWSLEEWRQAYRVLTTCYEEVFQKEE